MSGQHGFENWFHLYVSNHAQFIPLWELFDTKWPVFPFFFICIFFFVTNDYACKTITVPSVEINFTRDFESSGRWGQKSWKNWKLPILELLWTGSTFGIVFFMPPLFFDITEFESIVREQCNRAFPRFYLPPFFAFFSPPFFLLYFLYFVFPSETLIQPIHSHRDKMNNAFYSRPLFEHNEVSFEGRRERDDVEQRRGNKYRRESRQWPLYTVGELKKKKTFDLWELLNFHGNNAEFNT